MKQCPKCRMTVDAENECPFCQSSLVYEERVVAEKEHIVANKYFWLYLVKSIWFSAACLAFCAVRVILVKPAVSWILAEMITFCIISLVVAVFQRKFRNTIQSKYSEEYSMYKIAIWKYLFGGMAVAFSFFI